VDLHAAPGSPGIAALGECHPIRAEDSEGLLGLAHSLDVELVVIGPELPLVQGVADALRHAGIAVFGPSAAAAAIEGSKSFAKEVMAVAGVPAAAQLPIARAPCVVKADGLAAGKGVYVCVLKTTSSERCAPSASSAAALSPKSRSRGQRDRCSRSQTAERRCRSSLRRTSSGLTTPMGAEHRRHAASYALVPGLGEAEVGELVETIHRPVLEELARRGFPFVGLLYAGLMRRPTGRVFEFNCRFGTGGHKSCSRCSTATRRGARGGRRRRAWQRHCGRARSGRGGHRRRRSVRVPRSRRPGDTDHRSRAG
jgi:phosphoribosylamine--glycine ligase